MPQQKTQGGDMNAFIRGTGHPNQGTQQSQNQSGEMLTFEKWLEGQDDQVKALLDGNIHNLQSALESEREGRKGFEKQVRELAKKAGAGSEARKQLTELADQIAAADRSTAFWEAAHAAGVKNLKLAYTVAEQENLIDAHGRVNFASLKKDYPELFIAEKKMPEGNGGSGADGQQRQGPSMNNFIRRSAGRGRFEHPIPTIRPM